MNRLLLLHCGGTLGMVKGPKCYKTKPGNLMKIILSNPNISNEDFCVSKLDDNNCLKLQNEFVTFTTPLLRNGRCAIVDMFEFRNIIDSANASVEEFCAIAEVLSCLYDGYDSYVIVHGTDTLSYAASFLSFMVEGLTVPVVFTGAMLAMVAEGSDGESNLMGAIESSLMVEYPDVYIYFNGWLHRGVRTTKISSDSFDGFFSTCPVRIEDLARSNNRCFSDRRNIKGRPYFYTKMSSEVGIFKIYPSIHPYHFMAGLRAYKAVILETYGSGNFPSNREDLLHMIGGYIAEGGTVVNASQCAVGNVRAAYEASDGLSRLGVLPARDMTTECAFAKLSLLVANYPSEIQQWFPVPFRGEIDENSDTKMFTFNNYRGCIT